MWVWSRWSDAEQKHLDCASFWVATAPSCYAPLVQAFILVAECRMRLSFIVQSLTMTCYRLNWGNGLDVRSLGRLGEGQRKFASQLL